MRCLCATASPGEVKNTGQPDTRTLVTTAVTTCHLERSREMVNRQAHLPPVNRPVARVYPLHPMPLGGSQPMFGFPPAYCDTPNVLHAVQSVTPIKKTGLFRDG
eukprot:6438922-Prymnesium_polylepis.1